jgi:hypothetical protein
VQIHKITASADLYAKGDMEHNIADDYGAHAITELKPNSHAEDTGLHPNSAPLRK